MSASQTQVRRNTQLLDFVAHHSQDAIFLASPEGRIFFANPAASKLFGYSNDEFLAGSIGLIWEKDSLKECIQEEGADI